MLVQRGRNSLLGVDLAFRTECGTATDPANFRHYTYAVTQSAGLGRWSAHELRHSAASLLLGQGVPLKVVSSIRITADVYGHLLEPTREEAAEAMERALFA
jgi:integrase